MWDRECVILEVPSAQTVATSRDHLKWKTISCDNITNDLRPICEYVDQQGSLNISEEQGKKSISHNSVGSGNNCCNFFSLLHQI